ncbi:MAG: ATP-binding protein, partial [Acidobacteria bacterium]|nr:ATP-binding protein [Acidobacteriota bacterium]
CACGYLGDPVRECICTPHAVARYRGRISGPLLDRIDLHVEVPRPAPTDLHDGGGGEGSEHVRSRVEEARARQRARYANVKTAVSAGLEGAEVRRLCRPTVAGSRLLVQAMTRLALSARAHDAILKVAQTLADLEGLPQADTSQIAEAVAFRGLDRLPEQEV